MTEVGTDQPEQWSILESLLLAQAVYKYGDDNWNAVSRILKQHPSITRKSVDFFTTKVIRVYSESKIVLIR